MAYDSTTATALALRAYQRAQATTDASRRDLLQGYGMNADGSLDQGNTIGSIYQTNLGSAQNEQQARMADRRGGFGGTGGLGQRSTAQAHEGSISRQAGITQQATRDLAGNTLQGQQQGEQYTDQLTQIGSNKQLDDAETARQNQVLQSQQDAMAALAKAMTPPPSAPNPTPYSPAQQGAMATTRTSTPQAAIKKQPNIFQVIRNR